MPSDDLLALNPGLAAELAEGDWQPETDARKRKKDNADKKMLFMDALRLYAPTIPDPIGAAGRAGEFRPFADSRHSVDFAWPKWMLIVEVDGGNMGVAKTKKGNWIPSGAHTKDADYWKMNELNALGYNVFRFNTTQLKSPYKAKECVDQIVRFLKLKGFAY